MPQDPEFPVRIFAAEAEPPNDELPDEPGETAWLAEPPTLEMLSEAFPAWEAGDVVPESLVALSDLDRERLAFLRERWPELPEEVRVGIVSGSTDLAEDNVELHFGRLLQFALGDPSPNVRQFAVLGLAAYDDTASAEALLDRFQHDEAEDVRSEAAAALGKWAELLDQSRPDDRQLGERIGSALGAYAQSAAEPWHVRARALESASAFCVDRRINDLIDEFYAEDETGLRLSAVIAMGNSGDRAWLPILLSELESEDNELRRASADALGQIGDPDVVPALRSAIEDTDTEVRHAAILALGSISGPAARRILSEMAANPLPEDAPVLQAALAIDDDSEADDDLTGDGPDTTPSF